MGDLLAQWLRLGFDPVTLVEEPGQMSRGNSLAGVVKFNGDARWNSRLAAQIARRDMKRAAAAHGLIGVFDQSEDSLFEWRFVGFHGVELRGQIKVGYDPAAQGGKGNRTRKKLTLQWN